MGRLFPAGYQFTDGTNATAVSSGSLVFSVSSSSTAKAVYSDATLTTSSGSTVNLDSEGRSESEIFGAGPYRVKLYSAANGSGTVHWTKDDVWPVGSDTQRNVKDYGAIGDGSTDDTAAIQAAIDALGTTGGTVYLPKGEYRTTATININNIGITLRGDGTGGITTSVEGSAGVVGTGSTTGAATRIIGDFISGPVLRFKNQDGSVQDLLVGASTTRKAASLSTNYGIWVEAPDTGLTYESTRRFYAHRVRVVNQPSHGLVMVNDITSSRLDCVTTSFCKGHGIVIAGGMFSSRTNKTRPGQVDVWNCVVENLGGHGLLVGDDAEASDNDVPYRIIIHNLETYYCCITPSICVNSATPSNVFLSGESHIMTGSAIDGRIVHPSVDDAHTAMEIRGRFIDITNNRFIDGNPYAIKLVGHSRMSNLTRSVFIRNPYINNIYQSPGFYNPAIFYSTDCQGIHVESEWLFPIITKLSSRTTDTYYREVSQGVVYEDHDGIHAGTDTFFSLVATKAAIAGGLRSNTTEFTMADDTAAYIDFGNIARGTIVISGNVLNAGITMVAFRVGDANAHASVMSSASGGPTVTGGTGTLTGTTGTDTHLTIRGDTATTRLYIENRTGASRSYNYTLISINELNTVAQIVAV